MGYGKFVIRVSQTEWVREVSFNFNSKVMETSFTSEIELAKKFDTEIQAKSFAEKYGVSGRIRRIGEELPLSQPF